MVVATARQQAAMLHKQLWGSEIGDQSEVLFLNFPQAPACGEMRGSLSASRGTSFVPTAFWMCLLTISILAQNCMSQSDSQTTSELWEHFHSQVP